MATRLILSLLVFLLLLPLLTIPLGLLGAPTIGPVEFMLLCLVALGGALYTWWRTGQKKTHPARNHPDRREP